MSSSSSHSIHVAPLKLYFGIFFLLLVLTAVTVAVAYVDLGWLNTPVALAIAICKATVVGLFFMHLKWAGRLPAIVAVSSVLWLLIMLGITLSDYYTRAMVPGWTPF